jgi:hypothetical protein
MDMVQSSIYSFYCESDLHTHGGCKRLQSMVQVMLVSKSQQLYIAQMTIRQFSLLMIKFHYKIKL